MTKLILRKASPLFFSIEKVFMGLLPHLDASLVELPYESKGVWNRLRNLSFLIARKSTLIHITGHDHYLLWWPFKKAILTIHDIEALKRKSGWKKWVFKKLWFDIPIKNAKVVTTISHFSRNEILSLGYYKTPIEVIYNPLPFSKEVYRSKEFRALKPTILHIGVKENKNLSRLLEALDTIPSKLIVIGNPSQTIREKADQLKLDVEFKTGLSNAEVLTTFQNADMLAFVSTYEGFGLPIIEAQAVGLPVLTSNVTSMPEVAGEGALFVDPFSVTCIRQGIHQLIDNEGLRNSLIKKGLENIERFDPSIIAKKYNELYKRMTDE